MNALGFSFFILNTLLTASTAFAVLYGPDLRTDIVHSSAQSRELALSVAAIVKNERLEVQPNGDYFHKILYAFGPRYKMCASEPFYEQSGLARCSAALIGPDLILTASHCVSDQKFCEGLKFVFDFTVEADGLQSTLSKAENVFSCKKVLVSKKKVRDYDYAIVQLDREATGRPSLKWDPDHPVQLGDSVYTLGFPIGLPMKDSGLGVVYRNFETTAVAALNTYGGNSGGPIFDARTHQLVGVLADGEQDFEMTPEGCQRSFVCKEARYCKGEIFTNIKAMKVDLIETTARGPQEPAMPSHPTPAPHE